MSDQSFLLLQPGRFEPDQFLGNQNLLAKHGLEKISQVVLSGGGKIDNYQDSNFIKEFRKAPQLDIAPVADLYPEPSTTFKPLSKSQLDAAFTLEATGPVSLSAEELGLPVDSRPLLGSGPTHPPAAATAAKAAVKPIKLNIKLGGQKVRNGIL